MFNAGPNVRQHSDDGARRWGLPQVCAILLLGAAGLLTSACGPGENPCDGCKFGVCNEESGECVNASSCTPPNAGDGAGDAGMAADASSSADAGGARSAPPSDCLEGYSCENGTCVPDESCDSESDPCDRGTCSDGRCINSDGCVEDSACLAEYTCREGECVYAPCSNTDCERGVCESGTGNCVNGEECSDESSESPANCLPGYACHDGSCVDKERFCAGSPCDRGICDSDTASCVNADNCESDGECLQGKYCSDDGNCEANECYPVKRLCDRGVCDPADRSCGNPDSCGEAGDCAPMYRCIQGDCVAKSKMCGEEGCPGNQVCDFQEDELDATCIENPDAPCRSALDCSDDRVCESGSCESPGPCSDDAFEPNDGGDNATSFLDNRVDGRVRGRICSGDIDVFAYDTSRDDDIRGQFNVSLQYNPADVGVGDLNVRVLRPDGSKWFEKRVKAESGELSIQKRLGAAARAGEFLVVVEDPGAVSRPGIRYRLLVDLISQQAIRACEDASTLSRPNQTGNTSKESSVGLDSSCVRNGDQKPEDIYSFKLDKKSFVDVRLVPDGASDLSMAVRSECALPGTEKVCVNRGRVGAEERIQRTFEPGTYYLGVQAADTSAGGEYTLIFNRQNASCTSEGETCVSDSNLRRCSPQGAQFTEITCPTSCNAELGRCERSEGDSCNKAIDASSGLSDHIVDWSTSYDDLGAAGAACLPKSAETDGPDKVFRVEIPAGEVLLAELRPQGQQGGSLYVLEQCRDASVYCEKGNSGGRPTSLRYPNQGAQSVTVYLVADSRSGTGGISKLDVDVEELICQPSSRRCAGSSVEKCNSAGTQWKTVKSCSFGCTGGGCRANVCKRAFDVSSGGSWTFDPGNYSDDYSVGGRFRSGCFDTFNTFDGPDSVFRVDVPAGQAMEAKLTEPSGSTYDAGIYLVTDCSSTQTHRNTCFGATEAGSSGTATAATSNTSGSQETYYIVVDTQDSSGSTPSDFSLDVTIKNPICQPTQAVSCKDSSTLTYCSRVGLSKKTYTCASGSSPACSNGRCADPTGEICADYIEAQSGDTFSPDMSTFANDYEIGRSSCINSTSEGNEVVYRVNANGGETITVSADPQDFGDDPVLYIGSDCAGIVRQNSSVCVAGTNSASSGDKETLSYTVPSGEGGNYWIFVDAEHSYQDDDIFDVDITVK